MARIVFIGGGIVGTCTAMMLAEDGHDVSVFERDAGPPPDASVAWDSWDRRGVNQFRMLHLLLPRFRQEADAQLPGLTDAMAAAGALRMNPVDDAPAELTGGFRPGDERFNSVTARRPVAEWVVAARAAATDGLIIRRGAAVAGLVFAPSVGGVPHVSGVRLDDGTELLADLVVDAGGRRSAVAGWLRSADSPGPTEIIDDSGFVYYGRHYRSADGSMPPSFGSLLQPYGSVSVLTLPADNGNWGVGVIASSKDSAMRALSKVEPWERVVRSFPLVAHWIDAEPTQDIAVMAKIEDRHRSYVVSGEPVATGLVALADAWACTNPSLGRGISIGMVHAGVLRSVLRETPLSDARAVVLRFHEQTVEHVEPMFTDTLAFDRHRLAEIEAEIDGRPYETDDPAWLLGAALASSMLKHPDLMRGFVDIASVLERGVDVFARPGLAQLAIELADPTPLPGPDRAQLLALVGA